LSHLETLYYLASRQGVSVTEWLAKSAKAAGQRLVKQQPIGEQSGSGGFQNRYCRFSPYRREVFEELVQGGTAFKVIEEVLHGNTGACEA